MNFTEIDLRNIVREEIKKQCIFVKPSDAEDLEPMTYDYLINRNKGLPVVVDKKKNIEREGLSLCGQQLRACPNNPTTF